MVSLAETQSMWKNPSLIFLFVLLVLLAPAAYLLTEPFFRPLAFAVILAVACYPIYERIAVKSGAPGRAAVSTLLLLVLVAGIPATAILFKASSEAVLAANFLSQRSAEQGGLTALALKTLQRPIDFAGRYIDLSSFDLRQQISSKVEQTSVLLFRFGAAVLGNALSLLGDTLLCLFAVFFFLRDGASMIRRLSDIVPLTPEHASRLFHTVRDTIVANVYAMVAVGLIQGVLVSVGFLIVGFSSAILLGVAAAVASVIPVVGPGAVWIPAAAYLFATGHPGQGVFILIWGIVVVAGADNIVRPLLLMGRGETHPLLLILAIFGGLDVFGVIGLFLGPVLLSVISAILQTIFEIRDSTSRESVVVQVQ